MFPHDIGDDPDSMVQFAQTAEALGFSHLRVYDHVLGAVHDGRDPPLTGPYDERTPFHEVMVLFGFLAATTSSLRLDAGVLVLPQRQTALVAKQATEVDLLSRGRLRLGVGTGWNHVEYESLNETFEDRGRRLEDQVTLLRALWEEPVLDYRSSWHRVDRAGILPRPRRRIAVWFGGFAPVARRRAAHFGAGFMFAGHPDEALATIPELRAAVEVAGRDPQQFGLDVLVHADHGIAAWQRAYESCLRLGASDITLVPPRRDYASIDERLDAIRSFREALT